MRIKKDVVLTDGDDDHTDDATTLRKYYYTGSAVLFVADSSNNKLLENILAPNGTTLMSARYEQEELGNPINGYYTFNTDIRGSITNILNNGGTLTTGYVYDEYGNQIKTGDKDFLNEATYTGAIYDDESELYYMNARYYSASTGQFTTRDTYLGNISNPATHNLYTYTGNNPINFIDPTGQNLMSYYHTLNKANKENNQINSINLNDPNKVQMFINTMYDYISNKPYWNNQISNEYYMLTGR